MSWVKNLSEKLRDYEMILSLKILFCLFSTM